MIITENGRDHVKEQLRRACNALAKTHMVRDIVPDTATFVFLLESPHIQELRYGAPVSGSSGASMSRYLFGQAYEQLPLGIIVKKNHEQQLHRPSIDRIGLMNICNIPMQITAYNDAGIKEQHNFALQILGKLRVAGIRDYQDDAMHLMQDILLENLHKRLHKLFSRQLYIVPCGRFAQAFFAKAAVVSPHWQVLSGIPHPSYNNWSKPQYQAAITHLQETFRQA